MTAEEGLAILVREQQPMLVAARNAKLENDKTLRRTIPGMAATQGQVSGNYMRLYADFRLSASGNTVTCAPRESKLVSIYSAIGWVDKVLTDNITYSSVGFINGRQYDWFITWDETIDSLILFAVAWTNETTRATSLDIVDGVQLMNGDNTYRFIGTGRYNGSSMLLAKYDQNGELVFGTGDPHNNTVDPATGVWMSAPGITIGAYIWQFAAILAGRVGVGFNNLGQLLAGIGAVILDALGIKVTGYGVLFEFTNGSSFGCFQIIPSGGVYIVTLGGAGAVTVADSNFNSGAFGSGWNVASGSPTYSAANQYTGSAFSMLLNANSEGIVSDFITLSPSNQYLLDFWVYDLASRVISFTIEYFTSGGASLGTKNFQINYTGDAVAKRIAYLFDGKAPATTAKAKLTISTIGTGGTNSVYIQKVSLYQGTGLMIKNGTFAGPSTFSDDAIFSGAISAGAPVTIAEVSTPATPTGATSIYPKTDTNLYFVNSVGTEKQIATGSGTVSGTSSGTNTGDQILKTPIFSSGLGNTVAGSSTAYLGMHPQAPNATESNVQAQAPYAGTIKNLRMRTLTAQPAGGNMVVTFRIGGFDIAVTFTIAAGTAAGTFSDITHSDVCVANQALSIKCVNNAAGASAQIGQYSVEYDAS